MSFIPLEELLTGKALKMPRERLDWDGWVAAYRQYENSNADEKLAMEFYLANVIEESNDWQLIADAIHLARSLRMKHPALRVAIISAGIRTPCRWQSLISKEIERYERDVPQKQTQQNTNFAPITAGDGETPPISDPSYTLDSGSGDLMPDNGRLMSAAA